MICSKYKTKVLLLNNDSVRFSVQEQYSSPIKQITFIRIFTQVARPLFFWVCKMYLFQFFFFQNLPKTVLHILTLMYQYFLCPISVNQNVVPSPLSVTWQQVKIGCVICVRKGAPLVSCFCFDFENEKCRKTAPTKMSLQTRLMTLKS